ncbi:MAG: beta-galactosidase [Lentisphaeria bacterium]|nr:MAG: beta-galactosidase [Lentisphaeria bacterium]
MNTVTVEIGPRMVFPKEGRSHEFEPDFTYFDNRYNSLLQKAWENDIQVCLLVSPHYCPKWLLDKYPDMKIPERPNRKPGFIRYEITHPKAQEMIRRYLNALIPHLKKNPYAKAIHSICMSNEPEYLYSWPDNPVTVRNFTAWMEKKFGSIARFNAETGKNYPDFAAVVAAESKETAASYIFRDFVRETYAAWHRNFADEVRRLWPGVKVHSKIMISFFAIHLCVRCRSGTLGGVQRSQRERQHLHAGRPLRLGHGRGHPGR